MIAEAVVEEAVVHQEDVEPHEEVVVVEPKAAQRLSWYVYFPSTMDLNSDVRRNPTVTPVSSSLVERKIC